MQVSYTFMAGMLDVGPDQLMTDKAFIEACSNMANVHGKKIGQWSMIAYENHLAWLVLNWRLKVCKRPQVCDEYTVTTWSRDFTRLKANREYEITGANGEKLAEVTSVWVAIDPVTFLPLRLAPEMMEPYESEPGRTNFPDYKPSRGNVPELPVLREITVPVTQSLIDCYHHVHNSCYMDFVYAVLPEDADVNADTDLEMVFKKEIKNGVNVRVRYYEDGDTKYVTVYSEDDSVHHATIILK